MKIWVHTNGSWPVEFDNVEKAYVEDGMYCILKEGSTIRYPLRNIFRVIEEY